MRIFKIFIITLFFTASVYADTFYTQDKTAIMVSAKQSTFTIKLKSNATTGYSWFLREYNANLIEPVKHIFEPAADKKMIGAPGYEYWTFRVKPAGFIVPQQTLLSFVYVRPWESALKDQVLVFTVSTQNIINQENQ